jgi:SOS response regulatory protein OraA/RecX
MFKPPPLIKQKISEEIIEKKIKSLQQKNNMLCEKMVKWKMDKLIIGFFEYSGMSEEEVRQKMNEEGYSEEKIEELLDKLWELEIQSDKIQNDIMIRY